MWNKKKAETLLNDWKDYLQSVQYQKGIDYYMGTIIIHKDKEYHKFNIVDGQQRITTLLIIDYVFNGTSSAMIRYKNQIEIDVNNHKSKNNINTITTFAKKYCRKGSRYELLKQNDIFQHLRFTVIMTENEDDAFTFFDSQNNRGVQPSAVDVLKAVHLRAIHTDEILQKEELALHLIEELNAKDKTILSKRYGEWDEDLNAAGILEHIAKARKCLWKNEVPDLKKASDLLLEEFRSGKLGRISLETP